jgi:hypothetical protein
LVGSCWTSFTVMPGGTWAIWTWLTGWGTIEALVTWCAVLVICCSTSYAVSARRTCLWFEWPNSTETTTRANLSNNKTN